MMMSLTASHPHIPVQCPFRCTQFQTAAGEHYVLLCRGSRGYFAAFARRGSLTLLWAWVELGLLVNGCMFVCRLFIPQVSRLEQRIHAVTADNEALQADVDSMRQDLERARDAAAAASAGEGLARMPRDKWPLPVLMLVQAAEAAAVTDIAEKHVSTWSHTFTTITFSHMRL